MQINHVGVTTIERLDQGHLYPLGESRDKHVTGGARTSALLHRRRPLYLKSYPDSLYAGYSEPLLGLRPGLYPVLYKAFFYPKGWATRPSFVLCPFCLMASFTQYFTSGYFGPLHALSVPAIVGATGIVCCTQPLKDEVFHHLLEK